jgi:hypothetical protein
MTKRRKPVEVNEHGKKREVIVRHQGQSVRVLCDKDGIHVGSIVKA